MYEHTFPKIHTSKFQIPSIQDFTTDELCTSRMGRLWTKSDSLSNQNAVHFILGAKVVKSRRNRLINNLINDFCENYTETSESAWGSVCNVWSMDPPRFLFGTCIHTQKHKHRPDAWSLPSLLAYGTGRRAPAHDQCNGPDRPSTTFPALVSWITHQPAHGLLTSITRSLTLS